MQEINLDKLLYADDNGVFSKLRRGCYQKDEAQLDQIRWFAKQLNVDIRAGTADPKMVVYIVAIVHDLFVYADAGWTTKFATEIYETVNYRVDG